jgi:tetratricopeptide (TPR) repeat protein
LKGAEAAAVVEHLDTCDECVRDVALGMKAADEEESVPAAGTENVVRPRRWTPWLAAAAAVLLVLLVPAIRTILDRPSLDRLVEAAPKTGRVVEPRLTGGFGWAPWHGSERAAAEPSTDPERMKLTGAAGELVERAQHDASAEAQHDAGVAMVLTQNPEAGVDRLERAARATPSARTWSDLAAARYAAASALGRAALYPQALAAADAALRLDGSLPEALFNRALILERMGLVDDARAAWTRYLAADPSSSWADEARARLAELPTAKQSSQFERDRPLLEAAAERGDAPAVRALLTGHAARARAFAEAEYLGRWGDAVLQKKDGDAERWLAISRAIGSGLAAETNETLLRDAVQAIDDAPLARREAIAAAQVAYRAGRIAFSRQELGDAATQLTRAAGLFDETRSPMALAARFYTASVHQTQNDGSAAAELQHCLAEADAHPGYRALGAYVRWDLGRARMFDYDWPGAAAVLSDAAATFRATGDRPNEAFVESMRAHCLAADGRGDDSWSSRIRAFRARSAEGNAARLVAAIDGAMRAELLAGRSETALALARLPRPVAGDAAQHSLLLDTLQYKSMLESMTGQADEALRTAREAEVLAKSITDPSLRARRLADVEVAMGAATAASAPSAATASLTRAIDFYRRTGSTLALPEALLLRARCSLRTGAAGAAADDLEEGMSIVERHRARIAASAGTGILGADQALFGESIRMSLGRGEQEAAFATAERARGGPLTVAELQARLAGSGTAVLEIVMLPEELVTFAVTDRDFQVARRLGKTAAALLPLVDASLSESGTAAAAALYDDLVRPADAVLARVRNVIIVSDARLQRVPFAALFDATAGTYLIERAAVAIAPSAGSLHRDTARATTSVAAISLPSGGTTGAAALPDADRELSEITALYGRATTISAGQATLSAIRDALASADVVHVAGHTERQDAGSEHALLLAGLRGAGLERTSSRSIAGSPLPNARLLVLAACETLLPPASADTRAPSLGAAFAAAGVADIIGTLTPVGDRDARTFFRMLHRQLAAGDGAAEALRAAQVTAIQQQKEGAGSQVWRSIALLTSRIYAPGS